MTENLRPQDVILKRATRRQIEASGGVEAAQGATRVSKASLGHYQNPLMTDLFMPADVVIDLTLDSGQVHMLQEMAQLAGGVFIRAAHDANHPQFSDQLAELGKDVGLVFQDAAQLISASGKGKIEIIDDTLAALRETLSAAAAAIGALEAEREKAHG